MARPRQVKTWSGIFSEIYSPIYCKETGEKICIGSLAYLVTLQMKDDEIMMKQCEKMQRVHF